MSSTYLKSKSFVFARRIVSLHKKLNKNLNGRSISNQMVRSGTAIGALIREAEMAQSKRDFIHKLYIALKESNETDYWLKLTKESFAEHDREVDSLIKLNIELIKMLTSSIKTAKKNIRN